jgi:hypothetical protein
VGQSDQGSAHQARVTSVAWLDWRGSQRRAASAYAPAGAENPSICQVAASSNIFRGALKSPAEIARHCYSCNQILQSWNSAATCKAQSFLGHSPLERSKQPRDCTSCHPLLRLKPDRPGKRGSSSFCRWSLDPVRPRWSPRSTIEWSTHDSCRNWCDGPPFQAVLNCGRVGRTAPPKEDRDLVGAYIAARRFCASLRSCSSDVDSSC